MHWQICHWPLSKNHLFYYQFETELLGSLFAFLAADSGRLNSKMVSLKLFRPDLNIDPSVSERRLLPDCLAKQCRASNSVSVF